MSGSLVSDTFTTLWLGHLIAGRYFAYKEGKPNVGLEIVHFFVLGFGSFIIDVDEILLSLLAAVTCPMVYNFWFNEGKVAFWERSLLATRLVTVGDAAFSITFHLVPENRIMAYFCAIFMILLPLFPVARAADEYQREQNEKKKKEVEAGEKEDIESEESTIEELSIENDAQVEMDRGLIVINEEPKKDEETPKNVCIYDSDDSDIVVIDLE